MVETVASAILSHGLPRLLLEVCGWQQMTLVRFSVRFCKKTAVFGSVLVYKINRGFGFTHRFLHCVLFNVYAVY